jgi:two-component system, LuxR family, response regulator FixJ
MTVLTNREREVVELLAQGVPQTEIARRLCIEYTTVQKHAQAARQKTGCGTTMQLAIKAAWALRGE